MQCFSCGGRNWINLSGSCSFYKKYERALILSQFGTSIVFQQLDAYYEDYNSGNFLKHPKHLKSHFATIFYCSVYLEIDCLPNVINMISLYA